MRSHHLSIAFAVVFFFLSMLPATAQDEAPPPQFLYRDENRLILVNGETGDWRQLPHIEATDWDHYEWSPNGEYLLALLGNSENYLKCINLYDVDTQVWLYDEPIACNVEDAALSNDDTQLAYATSDRENGKLWLHTFNDSQTEELYRTSGGSRNYRTGINSIAWSPEDSYLTSVSYEMRAGGPENTLAIMHLRQGSHYTILGGDSGFYAIYEAIWSPDEVWFLLILQEEYVTSGTLPITYHQGDLYLIHSIDGEQYRLTYTPADSESNIRWTAEGNIEYDTRQHVTLSVEDAISIIAHPPETIVTPGRIDLPTKCPDTYPARNIEA